MANEELGTIAEQLFVDFMAPLVLGGEMRPRRPIGGRAALSFAGDRAIADASRRSSVQLARIRIARRLAPIDYLDDASAEEWSLAACLHDLIQSTHPELEGIFTSRAERLRKIALETLKRIERPRTTAHVLSRHTWFARMFEITRLDTTVSWWVGSRSFLGTTPPKRLMTWPDLRRVHVKKVESSLPDLVVRNDPDGVMEKSAFSRALATFLHHTPLTDLCTLTRVEPPFVWSPETLGLVAGRAGRTLTSRALRALPARNVNAALGRATRALVANEAWHDAHVAMSLLSDLTLASAQRAVFRGEAPIAVGGQEEPDVAFARVAGALAARDQLAHESGARSASEQTALLAWLKPLYNSPLARDLAATLLRRA